MRCKLFKMHTFIYLLILLPLCYSHYDTNQPEYALDIVNLDDAEDTMSEGRHLSVNERQNIRISAYYCTLSHSRVIFMFVIVLDEFSPTTASKIKYQLFPAAISYYKSALKVDPLHTNIKISRPIASACGNVDPPPEIYRSGIESDLVIFVRGKVDPNSTITASARACVLMQSTNRY